MIRIVSRPMPKDYKGICKKCGVGIECEESDVENYSDKESGGLIQKKGNLPKLQRPLALGNTKVR